MYVKIVKRMIDILFCIMLFPIFIIIFPIVYIMIKVDDNGPIIYKSKRLGKDLKEFDMYKFRTMVINAEDIRNENGSTYNSNNDERVTKAGKILRKTSIDELPQFLNVFKGNMSMIGPRPSPIGNINKYPKEYCKKFNVKPGITGYNQVICRNNATILEKQKNDLYYVNNISLILDIKIFFKTIYSVLKRKNIYNEDTDTDASSIEKKYLFLTNSNKLSDVEYKSRDIINISSMQKSSIDAILKLSYTVYLGSNRKYAKELKTDYNNKVRLFEAGIYRNIFDIKANYRAYKNLNKLLKQEKIDVIHCNTPIGGVLGRICGKKSKVNKIIYTAHGFHFYKGAPLINNLIYKNIERYLAHFTDAIITMNEEDYEAAKKFKLRNNGKVYFIHGVGIDLEKYKNVEVDKEKYYRELGINNDTILLISMGDLIKRKNYKLALEVISKCDNKNIKYLICGNGPEMKSLKQYSKTLNIEDQVVFLGYRKDIKELLSLSDIFLFTTLQEGLPRSLMEAMAMGLPCVVSNIRGNKDLIEDKKGGYLCNTIDEYADSINNVINNKKIRLNMHEYNLNKIKLYSLDAVTSEIYSIYKDIGLKREE